MRVLWGCCEGVVRVLCDVVICYEGVVRVL